MAGPGFGDVWSDDVRVAFGPARTYGRLVGRDEAIGWWQALRRPALVALVIGTLVPMTAVGRVTVGLVATATLSWSFAVGMQALLGLAIVASASRAVGTRTASASASASPDGGAPRITRARAIDLFFAGHVPWSLWLAAIGAWITAGLGGLTFDRLLLGILVTAIWTAAIIAAFCRVVLGTTPAGAWMRAVVHQAIVWVIVLSYIAWAAGGWFRLVE